MLEERWREVAGGLPRPFWVLFAGMFVNRAGSFVVSYLALWLTQSRGLSVTTAGFVAALWGAGSMVASPLGGYLADHVGRRRTMVAALTLGGLGMISLGFARTLPQIAPMVFLVSLVGECYRPAMQAAVADLVPAPDRIRAYGLIYWVINLGFSCGLALGGVLSTISFTLLFLGDGLTSLVFALLVWRAVPETRPAPAAHAAHERHGFVRGMLAPYRDRPFLAFVALSVAILLVFMQHVTTMPIDLIAHGVTRSTLGVILSLNGVLIVFAQPFLAPRLAVLNRSRVLGAGTMLVGLGFGINAIAHGAPVFALGVIVWSLGEIGVLPIANAIVADVALPELRGRYQGAYGLSFGIASFAAPILGSAVMQHFGAHTLWLGCLIVGALVAAGHQFLEPHLTRLRLARRAAQA